MALLCPDFLQIFIVPLLWSSLPWRSWGFRPSLSETQFTWLIFASRFLFATWLVLPIQVPIQIDQPVNPKSEPRRIYYNATNGLFTLCVVTGIADVSSQEFLFFA